MAEDLCESAMFNFVDKQHLKTAAPLRHAFLAKIIGEWQKESRKSKKKK